MISRVPVRRGVAVQVLLALGVAVLVTMWVCPSPSRAASPATVSNPLTDDFTHDTALNPSLWEINGPVGSTFGGVNCPGCTLIPLTPSFSTLGMEIASANSSYEVGTIQSNGSFAPPFTVNAIVEGVVSNGHPFVFGVTTADATAGVQITGNLNPDDCSAESNCADSSTCGTPANPSIPANQCYYGIYARIGSGSGSWSKTPALDQTPGVDLVYTLNVSVDTSGNAQYSVSQGGQVLGHSSTQVGTGPFYLILAQSEGAPVPGPGPNQADWMSVSVTPTAPAPSPSPSSSSSLPSWVDWLLVVVIAVVVVLVLVAWSRRRRDLTVTVLDSASLSPVFGAGVSAEGPGNFSGSTGNDGRVVFGPVRDGDYSVRAGASGYVSSVPVTISVHRTAKHTVRLGRNVPAAPGSVGTGPTPEGVARPREVSTTAGTPPTPPGPAPSTAPPQPTPPPPEQLETEGPEGWGGERIRQIAETFRAKGAISPETALTADELGLSRLFVRIMKRRRGKTRVFVEVNGRYYLNEEALRAMK